MLTQIGVITALAERSIETFRQNAESAPTPVPTSSQTATIRVLPPSACERCAAGQGCGAGLFARLLRHKATELSLPVAVGARIGQRVWLTLDERLLARQAWYWYGLPIIGFLLGAAIPVWLWSNQLQASADWTRDGLSLLSGVLVMAVCWLMVRLTLRPTLPRVLLNSPCTDSS